MLALVCIIFSSKQKTILPTTTMGVLRRALDILIWKWDDSKGIERKSKYSIDGYERFQCLMFIAYNMPDLVCDYKLIYNATSSYLNKRQYNSVNIQLFLEEITQWYGLLIPIGHDEKWTFVHRSIHDYLAARYWVESGVFSKSKDHYWDTRASYAMSMIPEATEYFIDAVNSNCELPIILNCIINKADINPNLVATPLIEYLLRKPTKYSIYDRYRNEIVLGIYEIDIYQYLSTEMVKELLSRINKYGKSQLTDTIFVYCLCEIYNRKVTITQEMYNALIEYADIHYSFEVVKENISYRFNWKDILVEV